MLNIYNVLNLFVYQVFIISKFGVGAGRAKRLIGKI